MDIKIFVFQHMPCSLPECFADREIYVPIQCGRAINEKLVGVIADDSGDNISHLNASFNEMTAVYWISRNYEKVGNPEYIGFDHYRRYLNWNPGMLSETSVVARRWFSWRSLYRQYACCHDVKELDEFSRLFKSAFANKGYDDYDRYWKTHFFYICNIFIMHRDNFMRYSAFILKCIDILRNSTIGDSVDPRKKRAPSFLLEAMTSYWIWHENRKRSIKLIPSFITHFNIENPYNGGTCVDKKSFLWFLRHAY